MWTFTKISLNNVSAWKLIKDVWGRRVSPTALKQEVHGIKVGGGGSKAQRENCLRSLFPLFTCLKIFDFCTFLDFWYPKPPPPPRFCSLAPLLLCTSEEKHLIKENIFLFKNDPLYWRATTFYMNVQFCNIQVFSSIMNKNKQQRILRSTYGGTLNPNESATMGRFRVLML